jgi:hypothetical protein
MALAMFSWQMAESSSITAISAASRPSSSGSYSLAARLQNATPRPAVSAPFAARL